MTEEQKPCRICHLPFQEYPMGEKNGYKLMACKSCGSVMVDPWMERAEVDKFFGEVQPEIVHIPNPAAHIAAMKKMIQRSTMNFTGKRFLDISCRQGYAVMAAKELGFQAKGIDPHDFFISFAKDKYDAALFECVSVQDYAAKGVQADLIFAVESFCEQTDPEGYAAALAKILAPGGRLYIQEPDGNNIHLPHNFTRWRFVDPPLNFAYLSVKGIKALLARHGLEVRNSFFTWGPLMRMVVTRKKAKPKAN